MSMNPTPFTPKTRNKFIPLVVMMFVALVLGLTAAVGVWQYISSTQKKVKELTVTRAVVIATMAIPAGTKLSDVDLTIKQFPAQAIPKDYPNSIDQIKGRIVKSGIQAEEIITEARLVGQGAAGGMPVIIPPGQRAITIKVNDVIGVGGFVNPGDRVDILSVSKTESGQPLSKTILQNVQVLAVGDKLLDPNVLPEPQAKVVGQITLALNPQDSERLALAADSGKLQLVLRPHSESTYVATAGATLEDVYGYFAPSAAEQATSTLASTTPSQPTATAAVARNSIEFILGNRRIFKYY